MSRIGILRVPNPPSESRLPRVLVVAHEALPKAQFQETHAEGVDVVLHAVRVLREDAMTGRVAVEVAILPCSLAWRTQKEIPLSLSSTVSIN